MSLSASTSWNAFVDVMFGTGFVALSGMHMRMIFEINRALPEDRRLRYLRWTWSSEVWSLHKELFPDSRVRVAYHVVTVIWLPFLVMGYFRFRQALHTFWAR